MKKTTKKQPTNQINYTEMVTAQYKAKIEENAKQLQKAEEARSKLLEIRQEEGSTPALEERIKKLNVRIQALGTEKTKIHRDHSVPGKVLTAARFLDNKQHLDVYSPFVQEMNKAIKQYQENLDKYLDEAKKQNDQSFGLQIQNMRIRFGDFVQSHSAVFAQFSQPIEPLKNIVDSYMNREEAPSNKNEKFLDEIVRSADGNI